MRRTVIGYAILAFAAGMPLAEAGETPRAALYKSPECGCCEDYADYLRGHGYAVTVHATEALFELKERHGVPEGFEGCHTTIIDGYVVEGHVPVGTLERLLSERPDVTGISLPGMPEGSPGMTGAKSEPFMIYEFSEGTPTVYAIE